MTLALCLLAWLLTKHWLCDFVLQTRLQMAEKGAYGRPGGLLHGLTHVVGTAPVFLIAPVPVAVGLGVLLGEFLAHYHLDWGKEQLLRRTGWGWKDSAYWATFGFDQLLHGATYLVIAAVLLHPW